MAKESRAFRKGLLLGGLVGAGILLWNAPKPGWQTREQVLETVEGLLFRVLDFPEKIAGFQAEAESIVASDAPAPVPAAVEPPHQSDIVLDARPSEMSV